jgi:hypothetical protein
MCVAVHTMVSVLTRAVPRAGLAQTGGFWDRMEERWFDRLPIEIQSPPQRPDGFLGSWWTTGALAAGFAGLQLGAGLMLVHRF